MFFNAGAHATTVCVCVYVHVIRVYMFTSAYLFHMMAAAAGDKHAYVETAFTFCTFNRSDLV